MSNEMATVLVGLVHFSAGGLARRKLGMVLLEFCYQPVWVMTLPFVKGALLSKSWIPVKLEPVIKNNDAAIMQCSNFRAPEEWTAQQLINAKDPSWIDAKPLPCQIC